MEFTEQQRLVYGPYPRPDGTEGWADPLLTHRHLNALLDGDIPRAVRELRSENAGIRFQATAACAAAACEAFGLAPFDPTSGQGTPSPCALALLADFLAWVAAQKKSGVTTPDSSSAA